jgi:hypothetical protein
MNERDWFYREKETNKREIESVYWILQKFMQRDQCSKNFFRRLIVTHKLIYPLYVNVNSSISVSFFMFEKREIKNKKWRVDDERKKYDERDRDIKEWGRQKRRGHQMLGSYLLSN